MFQKWGEKNTAVVIIASLKSEPTCLLINRIHLQGLRILISAPLRGRMSNYSASRAILQAFSKPCLVILISKDTHVVHLLCVQEFSEQRFFAFISLCAD